MKKVLLLGFIVLYCPFLTTLSLAPPTPRNINIILTVCNAEKNDNKLYYKRKPILVDASRQYNQTMNLLKTIVINWNHGSYISNLTKRSKRQDLLKIIILSKDTQVFHRLKMELSTWNEFYRNSFKLIFKRVDYPSDFRWLDKIFSPCASLRLFLPELLPKFKKVLYLDTDTLVFQDIRYLWDEFYKFSSTEYIGSAKNCVKFGRFCTTKISKKFQNIKDEGTNSGVLLMDLNKWRQEYSHWKSWIQGMKKYKNSIILCPDQILLILYLYEHPKVNYRISCSWNFLTSYLKKYKPSMKTWNICDPKTNNISLMHGFRATFHKENLAPGKIYREINNVSLNQYFNSTKDSLLTTLRNKLTPCPCYTFKGDKSKKVDCNDQQFICDDIIEQINALNYFE